jgi:RNA polymerase sigma factor (sigma-70 family)
VQQLSAIRPLSRNYRREERVEREIAALLLLPANELRHRLRMPAVPEEAISPECQVYMIRELIAHEEADLAWLLANRLAERMARRITRRLAVWKSLESYRKDEIEEALLDRLYRAWVSLEPRHEFWEVRFNLSLDRALADEIDKVIRHAQYEEKLAPLDDSSVDPWDLVPDPSELTPELGALISDAVSRLPYPLREAFWLRHREDWSDDEIAAHLGCTSRTVRNYLRRAEAIIATWRDTET